MFFPIRTDRPQRYTPWVNYGLIAVNLVVFLLTYRQGAGGLVEQYLLNPAQPGTVQFITYQFLHANWQHLLGNMLFLYVFGNSVEDRLGKLGYLFFYLSGGVVAGLGHALMETMPVLGASGAVAAVSGCYLVLFPLSNVTILYWLVVVGTFEVSGMMLILFQIAQDAVMYVAQFGGVAYLAHLSGYALGFLVGMGLLKTRLLAREPYDLMALMEQRRRRNQFHALTRDGYRPWLHNHDHPAGGDGSGEGSGARTDPVQKRVIELRSQINDSLGAHELEQAARQYTELLELDRRQVMGQQQQLDLANQLMVEQRYETAAHAYELFLKTYKGYTQRQQIELILGLIYARYLGQRPRAKELLAAALPKLHNPQEKDLAQRVLAEVSEGA